LEGGATIMNVPGSRSRAVGARAQWAARAGLLIEGALLALLAVQLARLVWVLVTPTGPAGDWQARMPHVPGPQARQALFAAFDPFYRLSGETGDTVQQVTSLPLQLFGIRFNEGSGLGAAIIADESGQQRSYAVGDEIAPGVTLKAVTYDHVVIERGGIAETLYIDQSDGGTAPVPAAASAGAPLPPMVRPAAPAGPGADGGSPTPDAILGAIDMAPRLEKGAVTGIVLSPRGDPAGFARAGFQSGDIVAQVNSTPVRSAADIAALRSAIVPGARLTLMVERGAATVPIAIILPGKK
jgi:general secretion pathway protein C